MAKYLLIYHGGGKMPETEAEVAAVMQAWGDWFTELGEAVVDPGNPVGQSSTVHSDGSVTADGGSNPVSGYSIIEANDDADAQAKAQGCPVRTGGGSIEVTAIVEM